MLFQGVETEMERPLGRGSQGLSLKSREGRLGRDPTFRARQRDGSMFKAAFNLLEHVREEDVLNWLPSLWMHGMAFLWFHQLQCREVCDPADVISLPPDLRLIE